MAARPIYPHDVGDEDGVDIRRAPTEPPGGDFPVGRLPLPPPALTPVPELLPGARTAKSDPGAVRVRGTERPVLRLGTRAARPLPISLPLPAPTEPPLAQPVYPRARPSSRDGRGDEESTIRRRRAAQAAPTLEPPISLRPSGWKWKLAVCALVAVGGAIAIAIGFTSTDDVLDAARQAQPAPAPVTPPPAAPVPAAPPVVVEALPAAGPPRVGGGDPQPTQAEAPEPVVEPAPEPVEERRSERRKSRRSERSSASRERDRDRDRDAADDDDDDDDDDRSDRRSASRRGPPGYFTVDAKPYHTVFVDGELVGDTPIVRYELPPGTHRIKAVASDGSGTRRFRITVESGETVRRKLVGDD